MGTKFVIVVDFLVKGLNIKILVIRRCKELESELDKSQKENLLLRQQLNEVRQVSGSGNVTSASFG